MPGGGTCYVGRSLRSNRRGRWFTPGRGADAEDFVGGGRGSIPGGISLSGGAPALSEAFSVLGPPSIGCYAVKDRPLKS